MSLRPKLPPHAVETIHAFLRAQLADSGARGVVVGLSGGIDSALASRIARDALGAEKVEGILLPDERFPLTLLEETRGFAESLGIEHRTVTIEGAERELRGALPEVSDRTTWGNTKARLRMTVLYALARESRRLVMGTGNKSELLLGYFTKYGDGGSDVLPLGDLYKTQVRELAEQLGLPVAIRERAPTAGLWEGQTDEGELGLPYSAIDQVLRGVEELRPAEEIARLSGVDLEQVRRVEARVAANRHKRRLAPVPKLSLRTVGLDWRD